MRLTVVEFLDRLGDPVALRVSQAAPWKTQTRGRYYKLSSDELLRPLQVQEDPRTARNGITRGPRRPVQLRRSTAGARAGPGRVQLIVALMTSYPS